MAFTKAELASLQKDVEKFPKGKLICIAKAVIKFLACRESGGANCIETLISDVQKCLKG